LILLSSCSRNYFVMRWQLKIYTIQTNRILFFKAKRSNYPNN